jgi:hypothetical protein
MTAGFDYQHGSASPNSTCRSGCPNLERHPNAMFAIHLLPPSRPLMTELGVKNNEGIFRVYYYTFLTQSMAASMHYRTNIIWQ